jgi:hypothetical protein
MFRFLAVLVLLCVSARACTIGFIVQFILELKAINDVLQRLCHLAELNQRLASMLQG